MLNVDAEISQSSHCSALVFDDPVCSLDHGYKENIAKRLVSESQKRYREQAQIYQNQLRAYVVKDDKGEFSEYNYRIYTSISDYQRKIEEFSIPTPVNLDDVIKQTQEAQKIVEARVKKFDNDTEIKLDAEGKIVYYKDSSGVETNFNDSISRPILVDNEGNQIKDLTSVNKTEIHIVSFDGKDAIITEVGEKIQLTKEEDKQVQKAKDEIANKNTTPSQAEVNQSRASEKKLSDIIEYSPEMSLLALKQNVIKEAQNLAEYYKNGDKKTKGYGVVDDKEMADMLKKLGKDFKNLGVSFEGTEKSVQIVLNGNEIGQIQR